MEKINPFEKTIQMLPDKKNRLNLFLIFHNFLISSEKLKENINFSNGSNLYDFLFEPIQYSYGEKIENFFEIINYFNQNDNEIKEYIKANPQKLINLLKEQKDREILKKMLDFFDNDLNLFLEEKFAIICNLSDNNLLLKYINQHSKEELKNLKILKVNGKTISLMPLATCFNFDNVKDLKMLHNACVDKINFDDESLTISVSQYLKDKKTTLENLNNDIFDINNKKDIINYFNKYDKNEILYTNIFTKTLIKNCKICELNKSKKTRKRYDLEDYKNKVEENQEIFNFIENNYKLESFGTNQLNLLAIKLSKTNPEITNKLIKKFESIISNKPFGKNKETIMDVLLEGLNFKNFEFFAKKFKISMQDNTLMYKNEIPYFCVLTKILLRQNISNYKKRELNNINNILNYVSTNTNFNYIDSDGNNLYHLTLKNLKKSYPLVLNNNILNLKEIERYTYSEYDNLTTIENFLKNKNIDIYAKNKNNEPAWFYLLTYNFNRDSYSQEINDRVFNELSNLNNDEKIDFFIFAFKQMLLFKNIYYPIVLFFKKIATNQNDLQLLVDNRVFAQFNNEELDDILKIVDKEDIKIKDLITSSIEKYKINTIFENKKEEKIIKKNKI